jgi:hypothetical protein
MYNNCILFGESSDAFHIHVVEVVVGDKNHIGLFQLSGNLVRVDVNDL